MITKRSDILISDLCEEIDYWKSEANRYKEMFEEERNLRASLINDDIERTNKGVAQALMFALSVKDNEDGSLSISKEDRKTLAENYK